MSFIEVIKISVALNVNAKGASVLLKTFVSAKTNKSGVISIIVKNFIF